MKRVLITGAAGRIGQSLAARLADRYDLRLLYHHTIPAEHAEAAARAREGGAHFSDEFGLSIICLRIGSFQERPRNERHLATWLSERDAAQLVWRSIEADVPFAIVYGISGNTRGYWDITSARQLLGYAPED